MSNTKLSDKQAFEAFVRSGQRQNRISWTPSSSIDPDVQRADRDDLNAALRRAGGHDPQHTDDPLAGTSPWKSISPGDEEGSA